MKKYILIGLISALCLFAIPALAITKQGLLDDLSGREFVDAIVVDPVLQAETAGSKWYRVTFREIVGNAMTNRSIDFYVIDEGTANERAYYKDSEPTQTI